MITDFCYMCKQECKKKLKECCPDFDINNFSYNMKFIKLEKLNKY